MAGVGRSFALLVGFAALGAAPMVAAPALLRIFVDDVLLRGQAGWLPVLVLASVATSLFLMASLLFRRRLLVGIEAWIGTVGEGRFIARLLSLPLDFFAQRHTGDLVDRLGAFPRFAQALTGPLADGLSGAIVALVLVAAALVIDPLCGLAVLAMAALTMLGALLAGRAIIARNDLLRRAESLLAA
eukprot:gene47180-63945_t